MYKQVYDNYIKNKEEIIQKTEKIIEADRIINTTYMHKNNQNEWTDEVKKRFERQKREIEKRISNDSIRH